MKTENYTPENLTLWSTPDSWSGTPWDGYYVFLGQNRDSDCLTRSNFRSALKALGGEVEGKVEVVREGHWACGWIEWIAVHESCVDALKCADEIAGALSDYPVVDESDFSELETEEANEVWERCYRDSSRVNYIREHRSQFDFSSLADLLACARGKYFCGYASELLA
jgi:hypothetical protein